MSILIGIDWSENQHDIEFMNEAGAALAQLTIPHSPDGFLHFDATRQRLCASPAECLVALETAHNLFIDFLWSHNYTQVYVVPPNIVKSSRGRFGSSGARGCQRRAFARGFAPHRSGAAASVVSR
jgi:Transposase